MTDAPDADAILLLTGSLRRVRKERGLTQAQVAHSAEISVYAYGCLERGRSTSGGVANPTLGTLLRVLTALRMSLHTADSAATSAAPTSITVSRDGTGTLLARTPRTAGDGTNTGTSTGTGTTAHHDHDHDSGSRSSSATATPDPTPALDAHAVMAEALRGALAGENWGRAAQILEESWLALTTSDEALVREVLLLMPERIAERFPTTLALRRLVGGSAGAADAQAHTPVAPDVDDMVRHSGAPAALAATVAHMLALRQAGRFRDAAEWARTGEDLIDAIGPDQPPHLVAEMPTLRLQLSMTLQLAGDHGPGSEHLRQALVALEKTPETDAALPVRVAGGLAVKHAVDGDLPAARTWLSRVPAERDTRSTVWLVPWALSAHRITRALIAIETLDREAAASELAGLHQQQERVELWGFAAWAQARYDLAWSDRVHALDTLDRTRERYRDWYNDEGVVKQLLLAIEIDLLTAMGRGSRAFVLLGTVDPGHPAGALRYARLALLTGDTVRALILADRLLESPTAPYRIRLDTLILRATAASTLHGPDAARDTWAEACAVREATGHPTLPFAFSRRAVIEEAVAGVPALAGVLDDLDRAGMADLLPESLTAVRLTEREQVVLSRLADGLSARAIAREQFVTESTIKSQTRSLYTKLRAHSRAEAIATAVAEGLL